MYRAPYRAIDVPVVGTACAYKDPATGRYKRAEIDSVPGGRLAEICLVDTGEKRVVFPKSLFTLHQSLFDAQPAVAIAVYLKGIKPASNMLGWEEERIKVQCNLFLLNILQRLSKNVFNKVFI
jgi:hypothetical protein